MTDNSNNPDELSMEEILSSIKGILSDTEDKSQSASSAEPETAEPSAPMEDDVFDLSASMVVEDQTEPESAAVAEPLAVEPENVPTTEHLQAIAEQLQNDTIVDVDAEPIFDSEDTSSPSDDFSILSDTEDDSVGEAAPVNVYDDAEPDVVPEMNINNLPDVEDDTSAATDDVLGLDNISAIDVDDIEVDSAAPAHSEPEDLPIEEDPYPAIKAETSTMPEVKNDSPANEPADVSEAIIDNFAQMFNANKPAAPASASVAPSSEATLIGAEAKTVADLVKEVLSASLQPVVEQKLQNIDADILQVLHAEIKAQAKAWVDANLNRVVEDAVKEEIKRVIAKVGS